MKSMVLLGAGASVESGVPAAYEMTDRFMEMSLKAEGNFFSVRQVLRHVVAGIAESQIKFKDKLEKPEINIEHVLRTVKMLAERFELEVSPFIGAWEPDLAYLDRLQLSLSGKQDISGLLGALNQISQDLGGESLPPEHQAEVLDMIVRQILNASGSGFWNCYYWMFTKLFDLAYITDRKKVAHYAPLVKEASKQGIVIASLNYDNAVEFACSLYDIPFSNGLSKWKDTFELEFEPGQLKLLKIHGSITWAMSWTDRHCCPLNDWGSPTPDTSGIEKGECLPMLLFGERNKLSAQGAMLPLLEEFRKELHLSRTLHCVGFSFRDPHVHELIWQWLKGDDKRVLHIWDLNAKNMEKGDKDKDGRGEFEGRVFYHKAKASDALTDIFESQQPTLPLPEPTKNATTVAQE